MKLQYLAIIFIIIILPIILVSSYYIQLQIDTINLQTSYNTKLIEAAKEGMGAYEINTVEWNEKFSDKETSKRNDVTASINSFVDSLANKMGIGGTSRNLIMSYIPAMAFTLYDGYYIYAPTNVDNIKIEKNANGRETGVAVLDENKEPELSGGSEFKHILRPFTRYSANYKSGNTDITVNYTLDNHIDVYGYVKGVWEARSGHLINKAEINSITSGTVTFRGKEIKGEKLIEQTVYEGSNGGKAHYYVYDIEGNKTYVDGKNTFIISNNGARIPLGTADIINESCKYTKLSVLDVSDNTKYKEYYQVLNPGKLQGRWFVRDGENLYQTNPAGTSLEIIDYSSVNYYVESYAFSNWVNVNLKEVTTADRIKEDGTKVGGTGEPIFQHGKHPSPEDSENYEKSAFTIHKQDIIQKSIEKNLNQAIVNYRKSSPGIYDFKMPQIEASEWEQIQNNVSFIVFLQGIPIGTKYYNNYAVATSTNNRDFASTNEIYFSGSDQYYHTLYCSKLAVTDITGYRSVDYIVRKAEVNNEEYYYYLHGNTKSKLACYYCIVDRSNYFKSKEIIYQQAYYTAIGRERYIQKRAKEL